MIMKDWKKNKIKDKNLGDALLDHPLVALRPVHANEWWNLEHFWDLCSGWSGPSLWVRTISQGGCGGDHGMPGLGRWEVDPWWQLKPDWRGRLLCRFLTHHMLVEHGGHILHHLLPFLLSISSLTTYTSSLSSPSTLHICSCTQHFFKTLIVARYCQNWTQLNDNWCFVLFLSQ